MKVAPSPAPQLTLTQQPTPVAIAAPVIHDPSWYVGKILFKSDRGGNEYLTPDQLGRLRRADTHRPQCWLLLQGLAAGYHLSRRSLQALCHDSRWGHSIWQQDTVTLATTYVTGGTPGADYDPAWAPDTRWVVYVCSRMAMTDTD